MEGWSNLGGTFVTQPCALTVDPRRLVVFGVGVDHTMQMRWRESGEWGEWESIGGMLIAAPVALSRRDGSLDLLCVTHDQSICHRSWEGRWGQWHALHGVVGGVGFTARPTVTVMDQTSLIVFTLSTDMRAYSKVYNNQYWGEWERLDRTMVLSPCAVRTDTGLHAIAVGPDLRLHNAIWQQGTWSSWEPLGDEIVASAPCVLKNNDGSVDVYYLRDDRALYRRVWNGSWNEPLGLEGTITETPTVIAAQDGRIDIFVVGEDRAVWQRNMVGGRWTWWRSLGGQAFSGISAVPQGSTRVELFILGRDSSFWHRTFIRHA
jgi:hypothetical protein